MQHGQGTSSWAPSSARVSPVLPTTSYCDSGAQIPQDDPFPHSIPLHPALEASSPSTAAPRGHLLDAAQLEKSSCTHGGCSCPAGTAQPGDPSPDQSRQAGWPGRSSAPRAVTSWVTSPPDRAQALAACCSEVPRLTAPGLPVHPQRNW